MLKRRLLALLLLLLLLTGTAAAAGTGKLPYAIQVNRACNTVTIYTYDENGQYTIPVKAMICSTARPGYTTPLGSYRLEVWRSEWRLMLDGTYGQYATGFYGNYLFHSICYADDSHDAMVREAYNNLGSAASMGCVRLETADAKWIYDNCAAGTPVTVYDDPTNPGPLGKPERTVYEITPEMYNGWDPTDPAAGNPWQLAEVTTLTVTPDTLALTAGEAAALEMTLEPNTAMAFWKSSDETIAKVDRQGRVTALAEGTVEIAAESLSGKRAICTVEVTGTLLPYTDLVPGAWYYPEIRQAVERGLFRGSGAGRFLPNGTMTRAMVVQALYNLAKRPEAPEELAFTDVAEDAWYRDAVAWASAEGLVRGLSGTTFGPDVSMTRQDLATVLWRYAGSPKTDADLSAFADEGQIAEYARDAMAWMTGKELLKGSGGRLQPTDTATRVETAAIVQRYSEMK